MPKDHWKRYRVDRRPSPVTSAQQRRIDKFVARENVKSMNALFAVSSPVTPRDWWVWDDDAEAFIVGWYGDRPLYATDADWE